ncbi:bifunctional NAD(P)H-hydrate repair enzyme [Blastomonas aquatica]|uniref:ADP-dependent (S)-NAD(P)H-hydrate dehydratase n=2 Tax=Blastomonas aquatica TaxID=1510276 RepID=A0ABQ1JKZ4_9SPHN|nr:bifunctional NAD(P)H-hydrate repair enzyme [Blastomonas aquatica]
MVAAEQAVFDTGVSVDALMRRAGEAAGEMIWRLGGNTPTLVLCGPGNNGGDGYVLAQFLGQKGVPVTVAALTEPRTDAARHAGARYQGEVIALADANAHPQVVDCLFGSGLTRSIDDAVWRVFSSLIKKASRSFAVDLPSGADADQAIWLNDPLHFDHVLALGAFKYAHLLEPVASACGAVSLIDIGVDVPDGAVTQISKPSIAPPDAQSHKYRRGLVVVVAGAMVGAALLAARAAQGTGAGYVKILGVGDAPAGLPADIVWQRADEPEAVSAALADPRIGAVLVGPGLGRGADAEALVDAAMACAHPLVLDADALHLLGNRREGLANRTAPVALTPHHGEFTALSEAVSVATDAPNKASRTARLAKALRACVLYKGADSVIAAPDGRVIIADRRCSWLSVAGTGDVLAGCITARLANHGVALHAVAEAVWLQDRAARYAGPAFTAGQLAKTLPLAVESCLDR